MACFLRVNYLAGYIAAAFSFFLILSPPLSLFLFWLGRHRLTFEKHYMV